MNKLLASTWMMYLKSQTAHWMTTGKDYFSTHKMLQLHYEDLYEAIDSIGEAMLMDNEVPCSSFAEIISESLVADTALNTLSNEEMLQFLLDGHLLIIEHIKNTSEFEDSGVAQDRLNMHKKWAWFLAATLKK